MTLREWGDENGSSGGCRVCRRKMWVENGCDNICESCYENGDEQEHKPQTLADVGMCEEDFR